MKKTKSLKSIFQYNFTLIIIIPTLVIGMIIITATTLVLNKEVNKQYETILKLFSTELEKELQNLRADCEMYKQFIEVNINNSHLIEEYINLLINHLEAIDDIVLIDDNGIVRYAAPYNEEILGNDMSGYTFFKKTIAGEAYYWSNSFISQQHQYPVFTFSTSFTGGILTVYLNLSRLVSSLDHLEIPENSYYGVVDQTGKFIAHTNQDRVLRSETEHHFNYWTPESKEKIYKKIITIDNEEIIYNIKFIKETNWAVIMYQPARENNALARRNFILLAYFVVIVIIVGLLYSNRIIQPILKSINQLVTSAREISLGNYNQQIMDFNYQELSMLGKQFNKMIRNIKERQDMIIESKEKNRRILEASPDSITVTDLSGYITDCNLAAVKMLGYNDKNELLGMNTLKLVDYLDLDRAMKNLRAAMENGPIKNEEYTLLRKDNSKFKAEVSISIIFNALGSPLSYVYITKNITDRKKIEEERENFIKELEDKQTELERFTYTVSHDLRSPLITIKGFLGLLEEDLENNDRQQVNDDIKRISNAVLKMDSLLNDLLELSRVGRLKDEKVELEVKKVLVEVIELLNARITERKAKIKLDTPFPKVLANPKRFEEIYQNLIENAIKYTPPDRKPYINLGVLTMGKSTIFYVKDNGEGISPQFHEKIFGLFDKLNPESEGTGIGLPLVKRIITNYGGRIWVESEGENKGSTFYFTLSPNP